MARVREFSSPTELLGREGAEFFGRLLAMISDVALVVDPFTGMVHDIANASADLEPIFSSVDAGTGKASIYELVTSESQSKIRDLLIGKTPERWRQVNFRVEDGPDVPIALRSLALVDNRVLLAGREDAQLARAQRRFAEAQRELETTFARLRDSDKRYRSLLNLLDIAVLTVEGPINRIEEISDEAAGILGTDVRKLQGRPLLDFVSPGDQDELGTLFEKIRGGGRAVETEITLRNGKKQLLRAASFQAGPGWRILVHFLLESDAAGVLQPDAFAFNLITKLPYGAVLTDRDLQIRHANDALAALVGVGVPSALSGHHLDEILGTRGLDTAIMAAELRDHGAFHNFVSALSSQVGEPHEVDVDGSCTRYDDGELFCFLIRPRHARGEATQGDGSAIALAEMDIRDRVGRMPLKAIVRQTTDAIEQAAIERALELTGNNRAATAEMLGVSRQNLYDKIERYQIGSAED